jgi:hypothetical protein
MKSAAFSGRQGGRCIVATTGDVNWIQAAAAITA